MTKIISFVLTISFSIISMAHSITDLKKAYSEKGNDYRPRTEYIDGKGRAKFVNHLILESSPYLIQHAHNPVNWYSFSDEAFEKAKNENKPIFISIGYATCHWCHVMEEESFDDIEVAEFLNRYFVAIKVDREIRPDIDATYMNVTQLLNGTGGWPLNAVILPNGRAFFAGTYFPKPRLLDILSQIQTLWQNEQDKIIEQADKIFEIINSSNESAKTSVDRNVLNKALDSMKSTFDELDGGFGQAPKFPHESMLLLLLDEQRRNPTDDKLNIITTTLDTMASGGLYDIVGGGFHRYSTDNSWLVPHFEKMLYNQAQLSLVYIRAYQVTQKPLYKRIATQTLEYLFKEMHDPHGGFFSATDADSEGEEGTYFVWTKDEIKSILNKDEFLDFNEWFDLSSFTNFEGNNIIRYKEIDVVNINDYDRIDTVLQKLYEVRNKRVPPITDNKVLLSWNALLIPSLLEAGDVFGNSKYTNQGLALADYLYSHFITNNQIYRVSIDGKLDTKALFEDYAYLANAFLSVFDYTADSIWLERVEHLASGMNDNFWDDDEYGFNMSRDNKYLNTSYKESYDGAIPSPNGVAYMLMIKLNERTNRNKYITQADKILEAFSSKINSDPYNYSTFISGYSNKHNGESSNIKYAYQGKIRVHTQSLDKSHILVNLDLDPAWHINSDQPIQDNLIGTKIENLDPKNWNLLNVTYPDDKLINLGFSAEKISVYDGHLSIKINIENNSKSYIAPSLSLALQACSDKVCLPPTKINLKP